MAIMGTKCLPARDDASSSAALLPSARASSKANWAARISLDESTLPLQYGAWQARRLLSLNPRVQLEHA